MRRVIDAQLEAFSRDDHEGAFSLASPGIRERFVTAETFARMVREQYAVVYRPASRTFLKPVVEEGTVIFPVRLSDRAGQVWLALYTMQRVGEEWRVAGCQLVAGRRRRHLAPGGAVAGDARRGLLQIGQAARVGEAQAALACRWRRNPAPASPPRRPPPASAAQSACASPPKAEQSAYT